MTKHVLVVTGSPRKGGNSSLLAEAFMQGATAAGHEVMTFDAVADPVQPCRACDACWSKGKACVFPDGFDRLSPLLEQADAIVLCGPVYWYSHAAQLKAAIDKLHAYAMPQAPRKLKGALCLLMCAADASSDAFAAVKLELASSAKFLGLPEGGQLLVPGLLEKGAVKNTDALVRAERFGRELRNI